MREKKSISFRKAEQRLIEDARERAHNELLRVDTDTLRDCITEYVEWETFALWIRAIIETDYDVPPVVLKALEERCPAFLEKEKAEWQRNPDRMQDVWKRVQEWSHNVVFGFAEKEGWSHALAYYAIRDPRYQLQEHYWEETQERWKAEVPRPYPTFEDWKRGIKQMVSSGSLLRNAETQT